MRTPPSDVPAGMVRDLVFRYGRLPVQRIHRRADLAALRRVEEEHVQRVARRYGLDETARESAMSWWVEEVEARCSAVRARIVRQERRRVDRIRRHRAFGSNALLQLYWHTVGPGARTWFGNRYVTIRRYTFRLRWRP